MKKLKLTYVLSCFLLCFGENLLADIPLPESLFRNGSNQNVSGNTVVLKILVQDLGAIAKSNQPLFNQTTEAVLNSSRSSEIEKKLDGLSPVETAEDPGERYLKLVFNIERDEKVHLLQVSYQDNTKGNQAVETAKYIKNLISFVGSDKSSVDQGLFFSTLLSLVLNKSDGFVRFLKKNNSNFQTNDELINYSKKKLLERHKNYLQAIKEDPKLVNTLASPLKPQDEEEKAKVKELMSETLYLNSKAVNLVKNKEGFFWGLDLGNFKGLFTNEKRQIHGLTFESRDGEWAVNCADYMLFDGIHELPKLMTLKTTNGEVYSLKILELSHLNSSAKEFNERVQKTMEGLKSEKMKNQKESSLPKLPFLY